MRGKRRVYTLRLKDGTEVALYWPEQLCVAENAPTLGAHYQIPQLSVDEEWIEEVGKEKAMKVLLWLDENLPDENTEFEGIEVVVEEYKLPDIWCAPHPDDYARLKQGERKRITELPEWEVYFGISNPDESQ